MFRAVLTRVKQNLDGTVIVYDSSAGSVETYEPTALATVYAVSWYLAVNVYFIRTDTVPFHVSEYFCMWPTLQLNKLLRPGQ